MVPAERVDEVSRISFRQHCYNCVNLLLPDIAVQDNAMLTKVKDEDVNLEDEKQDEGKASTEVCSVLVSGQQLSPAPPTRPHMNERNGK